MRRTAFFNPEHAIGKRAAHLQVASQRVCQHTFADATHPLHAHASGRASDDDGAAEIDQERVAETRGV